MSAHARERAGHRGATEQEITAAIRDGDWQPAESGRLEAAGTFPYEAEWNGTWYATKRVRVVFADDEEAVVVVTVYAYYGQQEVDA